MILYILEDDLDLVSPETSDDSVYICYLNTRNIKSSNVYYIYEYLDCNYETIVHLCSSYAYRLYANHPFAGLLFALTNISKSYSSLWITTLEKKDYLLDSAFFDPILRYFAIKEIIGKYHLIDYKIKISSLREKYVLKKLLKPGMKIKNSKEFIFIIIKDFLKIVIKISLLMIKSMLFGVKHVYALSSLKFQHNNVKNSNLNKTVFISPFSHISNSSDSQSKFQSDYWSTLPGILDSAGIPNTFLHFYINSENKFTFKSALDRINSFNEKTTSIHEHQYLQSYINSRVLLSYFLKYSLYLLKAIIAALILFVNSIFVFDPLFILIRDNEIVSLFGGDVYSSFLFFELFKSFLKQNANISKSYLVSEFKPWELAFVSACKSLSKRKIESTFVAHSNIRVWDLRYFVCSSQIEKAKLIHYPAPHRIGVNSEYHYNLLYRFGYNTNQLVRLEALRFLKYNKYKKEFNKSKDKRASKTKHILIVGDYRPTNTLSMLEIIANAGEVTNNYSIYLRQHPSFYDSKNSLFDNVIEKSFEDFDDLLEEIDIMVAGPTTSMAMASLYANLPCIYFMPANSLNVSPCRSYNLKHFSDIASFNLCLSEIQLQSDEDCTSVPDFYLDETLNMWKKELEFDYHGI